MRRWEIVTQSVEERTERIPVARGWLYRTIVFATRPQGDRVVVTSVATALVFVRG